MGNQVRMTNLVRYYRKRLGLSQGELGLMVHCAQPNISAVERGAKPCWPALKRRLTEALGVPENELFPGDEK